MHPCGDRDGFLESPLDFFSSHLTCAQEGLFLFKLEKNSIVKSEL